MENKFKQGRDALQMSIYKVIDPVVWLMRKVGMTPNMVTTVGLIGNLAAAAMILYAALSPLVNPYSWIGWGGLVIILSSLFDMLDGRLARTANMVSKFGAFYDSVLDRYQELTTLSAIAVYFMYSGNALGTVATFLSLIGSIMVSYVRARAEGLGCECKVGLMQRPERVVLTALGCMLFGLLHGSMGSDSVWFLLVPQLLIAVLSNATAVVRIIHVYKQLR